MFSKKDVSDKKLYTHITIKYDDGKRTHEEEFERYALFGKWMAVHYRKIKKIIYIRVKGTY